MYKKNLAHVHGGLGVSPIYGVYLAAVWTFIVNWYVVFVYFASCCNCVEIVGRVDFNWKTAFYAAKRFL